MEMKLQVTVGKNAGREILVPGKEFCIGRGDDCQLRAASEMISRRHCLLIVEDSYAAVQDLGSKNGTFVNEHCIKNSEIKVQSGDKLKVGPLEFVILLKAGLTGKKLPPVHTVKEAAARTVKAATSTDDDIAKWLSEGDTSPSSMTSSDTQQVRLSETEEIHLSGTGGAPFGKSVQSTAETKADESKAIHREDSKQTTGGSEINKAKKMVGKLPVAPTEPPKNSRDAAAEMIERFRRRR
jgi:pSer/pThr/pTyr-binding forkhead associated (FHA) protein